MWMIRGIFGKKSTDHHPCTEIDLKSTGTSKIGIDNETIDRNFEDRGLNLEGVITKLDKNDSVGVISNCYYFKVENTSTDLLAKGTVVRFNAERKRDSTIWRATDIRLKGITEDIRGLGISREEDGSTQEVCKTFSVDYRVLKILTDKIVVGPDPDCGNGVEPLTCVERHVEIGKEHLPREYHVYVGDWLHINFKGEDSALAEVVSVDFTEMSTCIGTVTKNRGHFCIDGFIYFTFDLIEGERKPCLGDKARAVAITSDQIPLSSSVGQISGSKYIFKKRAISVVFESGDTHNNNTNFVENSTVPEQAFSKSSITRKNVIMELISDKNKVQILPKGTVSFKTKILGSTSLEEVTIENNGDHSFVLTRIFTSKIQDVSKFDFIFDKKMLNPEDLFIELQPHRSLTFTIKCTPLQLGRTKELLVCDFGSFKIGRWIYVHSLAPGQDEIFRYIPEKLSQIRRKVKSESIDDLMTEKNMQVVAAPRQLRAPFFIPHRIGESVVPEGIHESFRTESENLLLDLYPSLAKELSSENYADQFKVSLWFEEVHNQLMRREYDLQGIILQRSEDYYSIKVPGLKEFHPPVFTGDIITIYESLSSTEKFEGPIMKIISEKEDFSTIFVQLPEKFNRTYDGSPYVVQFTLGRGPYKRMHFAVEQALKHLGPDWLFPNSLTLEEPRIDYFEDKDDNEHPTVPGKIKQEKSNGSSIKVKLKKDTHRQRSLKTFQGNVTEPYYLDTLKLKWYNHKLNDEQKDAVRRILKGQGRPLPYIVFGPPGTGKTVTVVEAILQVYFMEPASRILVTVPSNVATDLIAEHLVATNRFKPGDFVRLNGFLRYGGSISSNIVDFCKDGEHLDEIATKRLIISTVATAGQFFHLSRNTGHFSHVFIDEAGYCTEPETMIPCVLAAIDKQSQVVLVGDPEQLGPVLMCNFAFNKVLERSFLERLMNTKVYARDDQAYPGIKYNSAVMTKLVKSYRSHPLLLELPSKMFYSDELVSCARTEDSHDLLNLPFLPKKGVPLVFHGIDGNCSHDIDSSPSWFNPAEVYQVIEYVKLLRRNGVANSDIGIITPYRKQVEKIRVVLKMILQSEDDLPRIASVQEFQGGERKVIIISTVRSYAEDIIERNVSRLDFLYSKKRFNVAVTRAKALMIVIGNPVVLSFNTYWRQLLEYAVHLGVYTGCQLPNFIDSRWGSIMNGLAISQVSQVITEDEAELEFEDEEEYYCDHEYSSSRF